MPDWPDETHTFLANKTDSTPMRVDHPGTHNWVERVLNALQSSASPKNASVTTVSHGADANVARPSGFKTVIWVGSIEPSNANPNDIWMSTEGGSLDTSPYAIKSNLPVNVKDKGAVADGNGNGGGTDNAEAFQSALNSGDHVYVPPGIYRCDSGLTASSRLKLEMAPGATIDFSGAPANTRWLTIAGTQGSSVALTANAAVGAMSLSVAAGAEAGIAPGDFIKITSDAIFDSGRTNTEFGEIVEVDSTASGVINLRSPLMGGNYNTADTAIIRKLTMVEDISISGGKLVGGGTADGHFGFEIKTALNVRIRDVRFHGVDTVCVQLWDTLDFIVDGCRGVNSTGATSGGYIVSCVNACQNGVVKNNTGRRCRHVTSTNNSATLDHGIPRLITFENNRGWNTLSDSFDTHSAAERITFLNNVSWYSAASGINIECPRARVIGNEIYYPAIYGILLRNYSSVLSLKYEVLDNEIIGPGDDGIRNQQIAAPAVADAKVLRIERNTIREGADSGIYVSADQSWTYTRGVSVCHNQVAGGASFGIYLNRVTNAKVIGNEVADAPAAMTGIRVDNATKTTVHGNTVAYSVAATTRAFQFVTASQCTITGNTANGATGVGGVGLELDNASTYNVVSANNVRGATTPLTMGTGTGNVNANNIV